MKHFLTLFLSVFCLLLCFCAGRPGASSEKITGYNFLQPDASLILPDTLREISGLTVIDSSTVACVQDENGILFLYNIVSNQIVRQHRFTIDGDYEGITRIGKTIYVLRSDGVLFEIVNYEDTLSAVNKYATGIPSANNEGLCYDPDNNRLLIACKGKAGKGPEHKDRRAIYAFDLAKKTLSQEPVFDFELQEIKNFAAQHKVEFPQRVKKKDGSSDVVIKFRTSAICIHPLTKRLYLLSAADHALFIFGPGGLPEHIELLDPGIFNKSEGITFFSNGDALITNEAQNKKPTLLRFNYTGS
ncbi:MAG: hypothetical protein AB1458_02480 [Bacteroidota bacterium]